MSTPHQAQIELGVAASNIAGNIDALLPQLAGHGAEVAKTGNAIHDEIKKLREISVEFQNCTDDVLKPVAFDKSASEIKALLSQLTGNGAAVDGVAKAIESYCNQLVTVHAQHLHLTDPAAALPVAGSLHVNNGIGSAPYTTPAPVSMSCQRTHRVLTHSRSLQATRSKPIF